MSTWYLGPLGDLRPLVCPDTDIKMPVTRYGGVHQGLSGARTMDVTGHRQDFEFSFSYLDQEEYRWYEALHTRLVPGPFRLLNPMKTNRLTLRSSNCVVNRVDVNRDGMYIPSAATVSKVRDFPDGYPGMSVKFTTWPATKGWFGMDRSKPVPLRDGETLTLSVYIKADTAGPAGEFQVDWIDVNGDLLGTTDHAISGITTSWSRVSVEGISPVAGAVGGIPYFVLGDITVDPVYVAMPQAQAGALTDWEIGGAAPEVLLDQLPVSTPRFPLRNVQMTLLEA